MSWMETIAQRIERERKLREQYPEFDVAGSPDRMLQVDNHRMNNGGGPISEFSQMAMRLAKHAAEQVRATEVGAPPEVQGASDWEAYNRRRAANGPVPGVPLGVAEAQPGTVGQGRVYQSSATDELGDIGGRINRPLAQDATRLPVVGEGIQHALNTPVVGSIAREATRPTNWMSAAVPALSFAPEASFGVRLGAEVASQVLSGAASQKVAEKTGNPLLGAGAGLLAGGVGGAAIAHSPRLFARNTYEAFSGLPEAALKVSDQLPDNALRRTPMLGGGADPSVTLPPTAAGSATQRLFSLQEPKPGLSVADRAMNALKRTVGGRSVEEQDIATPIMRERQRVQQVVDSQSARLGSVSRDITKVFKTDKYGRIQGISGTPTLQDLAAKLPLYERYLNPAQKQAIVKLQSEVAPYGDSLREMGVEINKRPDIIEGGFYLPRGRADLEGADMPVKISGRSWGGRSPYKKPTKFESMAEGIDKGYEYIPIHEALQSYAKQAGTDAVDAWTANEFKATGLGESAADRINPNLRAQVETLRSRIASTRQSLIKQNVRATERDSAARTAENASARISGLADNAEGRLNDVRAQRPDREIRDSSDDMIVADFKGDDPTDVVLEKAKRELSILNREAGVQLGRAQTASERGGAAFDKAEEIGKKYDDMRQELDDISGEYKRMQEQAAQTPRDQGRIDLPGLNKTSFPDAVANVANKYLNAEKPASGRGTGLLHAADALNNMLRMLRATGDVSMFPIQGLLGSVSHPIAYAKASAVAIRAIGSEEVQGQAISHFDEMARAAGRPDSRTWASVGAHFGGSATEFTGGTGAHGRIVSALTNAPVVKQTNRAFSTFGDTMRLYTSDAIYSGRQSAGLLGKNAAPEELQDISRAANLLTGWSKNDLGPLGHYGEFAPRFFRSQLDLVGHAMLSGHAAGTQSATGDEARRALVRLIGIGAGITLAANQERGYDIKDTLDVHSPNFMRIRNVGGQDISLFGPWDSLVKGVVHTAGGDPTYFARTKASPVVSLAWDYLSGENFIGQSTRSSALGGRAPDKEWLLRQFLPFAADQYPTAIAGGIQQAKQGDIKGAAQQIGGALAIGETGLKASPLTPTENLNQIAQDKYQKDFYDLGPAQQDELRKANPELAKQQLEAGSEERQASEKVRAGAAEEQGSYDAQLQAGTIDVQAWKDLSKGLRNRTDGSLAQIYIDQPDREPDPNKPWEVYGKVIADNTVNHQTNWDAVDEWRAKNDDKPFEDGKTWGDAIDENTGLHASPLQKEYRSVGKQLDSTGYFAVRDRAWADVSKAFPKMVTGFKNYGDWYQAQVTKLAAQLSKSMPEGAAQQEAMSIVQSEHPVAEMYQDVQNIRELPWVAKHAKDGLADQAIKWGYFRPTRDELDIIEMYGQKTP